MQQRVAEPALARIRVSALAPLREPLFRRLWIAAVISYIGTWMQNLGAGWLMASLTSSPLMVGLVQAAMALPVFLVVLPAGALADLVDRRKLLLITQSWMVVAAAVLGVLTLSGHITPWLLLLLTFILGLGAVMNDPAWQAITPEVVSRANFASAVALNSAGFNVARAIGPALGGLIIATAGSGSAFLLNAVSFFGVILFLHHWQRSSATAASSERMLQALGSGFRHLRDSAAVKSCLVRTLMFSFAASAVLALLPIIALPHGSVGFGIMLGFFGLGALLGTAILSRLRHHLG
ncbi:MAG TPA: MFS transporter, partial [Terriglobales bacterium]|nr:MFS transporter [Terriglobales bacterium]